MDLHSVIWLLITLQMLCHGLSLQDTDLMNQAGSNDIILIIRINRWFKASLHTTEVLIIFLYYKVDIIFRSNDLEEKIFIFTPEKSIAVASMHASSF